MIKRKYTDTELLDWLEAETDRGACPGLINDDDGRWAVSFSGTQNIPDKFPGDIWTSFRVKKKEWKKSIREAIIYAMETKN